MELARERFLDDTRDLHVTLSLRSRTTQMHSLLTGLTNDQRDAVSTVLAGALDQIATIVAPTKRTKPTKTHEEPDRNTKVTNPLVQD